MTDVNEAQTDFIVDGNAANENVAGAVIGNLTVADPDAGDHQTFEVSDNRFEVVDGQLKLKTGVSLDRESEPTVTVTVTATDEGGHQIQRTVTINVGDVNEAQTALSLDGNAVAENAAGAVIGPRVRIGRQCVIGANAVIANSLIGDRVVVHPGCAIGQDGFGYVMGAAGHRKVMQVGRVIVQDEVEIGAGTTIDRGANRDTVIGEGTKIDNLVQIGHNVSIGRHCIIVLQCGISGSVVIEDRVILAGQVGLPDNVTIGEGAVIGAKSGVISDVPPGEKWFGYPAMRGREFLRSLTTLHRWVREDSGSRARDEPGRDDAPDQGDDDKRER